MRLRLRDVVFLTTTTIFLVSQLPAVSCDLIVSPVSTAVVTGWSITLECLGVEDNDTTSTYEWQYTPMNHIPVQLVHNCQLNPDYVDKYQLEVGPEGGCNVVLLSATGPMAGTYTCQYGFDQGTADVIILGSNSSCAMSPVEDLVPGDQITYTCYVNYNGTIPPSMRWRDDTGTVMTNATVNIYPNQVNTRLTVPVYAPNSRVFTCQTYFNPPITFTFTWSTPTVDVQYPATIVNVTASGYVCETDLYSNYTTLQCTGSGFPAPNYYWTDQFTGATYNGSVLDLVLAGSSRYKCTVSNVIRGVTYTDTKVAEFKVLEGPPPELCPWNLTITECGSVLHVAPNDTNISPGWNYMCYIERSTDVEYIETPCRDLIQNLPPDIGDASSLVAMGGDFGCALSTTNDFNYANIACHEGYQQNIRLANCASCPLLFTCIQLPSGP